jgi:hypothetical protein
VRLTYNLLRGASTANLRRLALALKVPEAEALPRALLLNELEEKIEALWERDHPRGRWL